MKVGFALACRYGLEKVAATIRGRTNVPIIYDHQKGGTDIPDLAEEFAGVANPVDAVIIFPMAGPVTQRKFIECLHAAGKPVIVGAVMTHAQFLASEGGYIVNDAPRRILELAMEMGVRDFVVPATSPKSISEQRTIIERHLKEGDYDLFSPGLVSQGGTVEGLRAAAGPRWHGIVGRAVYASTDPSAVLSSLASLL
jgi:orotidine-5'-phosphate decarboxylase